MQQQPCETTQEEDDQEEEHQDTDKEEDDELQPQPSNIAMDDSTVSDSCPPEKKKTKDQEKTHQMKWKFVIKNVRNLLRQQLQENSSQIIFKLTKDFASEIRPDYQDFLDGDKDKLNKSLLYAGIEHVLFEHQLKRKLTYQETQKVIRCNRPNKSHREWWHADVKRQILALQ